MTPLPRMLQIFKNAVMGVGAIVSDPIDMLSTYGQIGLEIVSTGTPTGVYTMEGSNQYNAETNPGATFVAASVGPSPAFPVPAGAGAQTLHSLSSASNGMGRYVRLRYVGSGGAGVLNAFAFVKMS